MVVKQFNDIKTVKLNLVLEVSCLKSIEKQLGGKVVVQACNSSIWEMAVGR